MPIIRVSSDEGKPHSSKAGRREASQRAYKRQFGGSKKRAPTDIVKKLRNALAGGIKGKPHSSPEGQAASAGRTIKRLGQRREDSLREIKPFKRKQAEIQTKLKSPEEYKAGGAVTRFRSSGPEGKPHSTKEGRSAEAQRAYMRKHGKPDKKRIQIRPKVSDRMQKLRDNLASVSGGEWGKKSGGRIGKEAPRQKKKIPIITVVGDSEGLRDAKKIKGKPHSSPEGRVLSHIRTSSPFVVKKATGGRIGLKSGTKKPYGSRGFKGIHEILGGSEKAKPHSTKEGRVASGKRRLGRLRKKAMDDYHDITWAGPDPEKGKPHSSQEGQIATGRRNFRKVLERYKGRAKPLRAKKSVGGIAKIIGRKAVDWIKKNKKTIKKEIYSPEGKKKTQDLTKKLQEGLKKPGHAKGGRIGLQHGNRPRPQGPHTWVKSGGAVLKGKKVGIQIK